MVVAAFACIAALGGPSFWSAFLLEQLQKGKKAYKGTKPFDHTKTKVWHQAQAYFAKPTPTNNNGANADANDTAARTFNATLGIPRNPSVFYTEVLAPPDNGTATEISLHSTSGEEEVDDDLDEVSLHCASDEEEVDDDHNEV